MPDNPLSGIPVIQFCFRRRALQSRVRYCLEVLIRGSRSQFTDWQVAGGNVKS
jgi:hypothetical protein